MCKSIDIFQAAITNNELLKYCWKHKLTAEENRVTTDGKEVFVIDQGLHNRQADAPDFFNAKVRINGTLWVGNVVVTDKASDWYLKGMDRKSIYDNVVLAVVGLADTDIINSKGQRIEVMRMHVPQHVTEGYEKEGRRFAMRT